MKKRQFFDFSSEFGDFSVDGGVTKGGDASGCEIAAVVRHQVVRELCLDSEKTFFFF